MLLGDDLVRIEQTVSDLLAYNSYLLERNVYERAITHRLGTYLQARFGDRWDVDCEYDKAGEN